MQNQNIISENGFSYKFDQNGCYSCQARCCRGQKGNIFVSKDDIENISNFLDLNVDIFKLDYLRKEGYRYSIKDLLNDGSYDCVFYDKNTNGCSIYQVRPNQCKTFPFWNYFKENIEEVKKECPAIID